MNSIKQLLDNQMLIIPAIGWFTAQLMKAIITWIADGKFNKERLVGAGGMPSSHSAAVCALALTSARFEGVGSSAFALSFLLAAIVIYDAMGVRREAGEHAKTINLLIDNLDDEDKPDKELKEFIGHTPLQVLCGALIGILLAMIIR
jgi:uncharacterized protein